MSAVAVVDSGGVVIGTVSNRDMRVVLRKAVACVAARAALSRCARCSTLRGADMGCCHRPCTCS